MAEIGETAEIVDELVMESLHADEHHAHGGPRWHTQVALSSLVLAVLTALGGLLAGIEAHESLLERTKEVIEISRLEGDRVSIEILETKHAILESLEEPVDPAELEAIAAYREEAAELAREASLEEARAQQAGQAHIVLAVAVTVLSVGITLSGMAVVVERKRLWHAALVTGALGGLVLAYGIVVVLT